MVILDGGEALVSRLDRALKRRDRELNQISLQPEDPAPVSSHDGDSPIAPVGLIDHFPIEPDASHETRPSPVAPVTKPLWRPVPPRLPELKPSQPRVPEFESPSPLKSFSAKTAGKVVGGVDMDPRSAEQYRRLAASLHQAQVERGIRK